jgi:hypothetical protein
MFKPFIFSVFGVCLILYYNHVHFHDFVTCTILLYNHIRTAGWKLRENRGWVCTLENFQWCEEPCFLSAAILRGRCLSLITRQTSISHYWSDQCLV